ncbi:phosphate/phosphite/phosphonate ABC transporter substrate-binding protein [Shewanella psychropiezotolerans]|uniref:Phosphate/phosphite/phosphonate ABC transporter substrate-binding protein n=1 Tax=Shewanella psychropiezotolerans TaxID=2593655 RepID=A0ABX5WWR8_9GAMM|nr:MULTISPECIES: phosphate/phosphite/phosphonate ABC transporter substrate-binding protein [Shewanella]MPY24826.1 phosphate/phosphite/phosphonate ABC transporter substrate-binding protein [Shewanella sp. YLB-07]QDO83534.1 phosphate/phosphite/phosphonate ABC transporter substrate-binding protein [Shewanella psychropiezotolerans]
MKISQWLNTHLFLPIALFFCGVVTTQASDTKHTVNESSILTFGVVPQQAASMLARKWSPLLAALSQNANFQLHFATAPDIPTFEKRLAKGEYDIAYMNPYHFTVFNESPGYLPLVKEQGKKIKGIIVVQKISTAHSLLDLDGQLLAFPAPAAFAASVLPRANLKIKGINNQIKYVGSHDSVYLAVAQGLVAGGGGVKRTFKTMDKEVTKQLRVLWETPGYTPHAVAIHPRVPVGVREELMIKFTQFSSTQEGTVLLEGLGFKPFEAAKSSDWNDVRALGLGDFSKPLETNDK